MVEFKVKWKVTGLTQEEVDQPSQGARTNAHTVAFLTARELERPLWVLTVRENSLLRSCGGSGPVKSAYEW